MNNTAAQRQITAFWDTVAAQYDAPAYKNVASPGSREYDNWSDAVRPLLPARPSDVLDVGTGTGFLAGIAARLGHNVTAIDLSTGMLDAATLRATGPAIAFAAADAVNPPFPARSFDAVISRSLIWTLREPATAFRNWHRLLRPGGRILAIYGLAPAEPHDAPDADTRLRHAERPRLLPRSGRVARRDAARSNGRYPPAASLLAMVSASAAAAVRVLHFQ